MDWVRERLSSGVSTVTRSFSSTVEAIRPAVPFGGGAAADGGGGDQGRNTLGKATEGGRKTSTVTDDKNDTTGDGGANNIVGGGIGTIVKEVTEADDAEDEDDDEHDDDGDVRSQPSWQSQWKSRRNVSEGQPERESSRAQRKSRSRGVSSFVAKSSNTGTSNLLPSSSSSRRSDQQPRRESTSPDTSPYMKNAKPKTETTTTTTTRDAPVVAAVQATQKQFMEDLSTKFPAQMEETRLKVRRDVRRSAAAAKHLATAQVCFVLAIVLVKHSLQHFTPSGFMASRALVSVPFILALARSDPAATGELVASWRERSTSGYVAFLGVLVFLGQLLLYLGLERVSVGNTVVLGQLVPVYSCTIAVFQGVEKPSVGKFVAIGAGVLGAAVMLDPAQMWLSQGNLFLLARAATFAAYLALQAPILQLYLPVAVATASQLVGAALSVAVGIPLALHAGGARAALGSLQAGVTPRGVAPVSSENFFFFEDF